MTEYILKLIDAKKQLFKNHTDQMVMAYDIESKTISGYNGRQLFELIQNCDDQGSEEVFISLDTEKRTLSISNNGKSFSREGYASLFTPFYSSKVTHDYIGNKGLGFRSIINWSNGIEIHSNGISLIYTEQSREETYKALFTDEERQAISNERNFKESIVPMPFLSIPKVKITPQGPYVTTITIHYKEDTIEQIRKQIDNINAETLLFLNSIKSIGFSGIQSKQDIKAQRKNIGDDACFQPFEQIIFKDTSYIIFKEESDLPEGLSDSDKEGKERYQVKMALEESGKAVSPFLYSFFPTTIRLNQPYILHATFDLDVNRNQINNTQKNIFILERVAEFIVKVAKYYCLHEVTYKPLSILYHAKTADTLENLGYYTHIEKALKQEEMFPCVDGKYRVLDKVFFLDNDFAEMLNTTGGSAILVEHLISTKSHERFPFLANVSRDLKKFSVGPNKINEIARLRMSTADRAQFIKMIVANANFIATEFRNSFAGIINEAGENISGAEFIFTPPTNEAQFTIPVFAKVQFMQAELFNELVGILDYDPDGSRGKSRFVYDKLTEFCNIHSYEPAGLAAKIVSATKEQIKKDKIREVTYVKEMNRCLLKNYLQIENPARLPEEFGDIPNLSADGKIRFTKDLVLGSAYITGTVTATLFKDIYSNSDYIAAPQELGIDIDDIDNGGLEQFLEWMHVSKFARYRTINSTSGYDGYVTYLKSLGLHNYSTIDYRVRLLNISGYSKILQQIGLNKLIAWIHHDQELRRNLLGSDHHDKLECRYRNSYQNVPFITSFLRYIFLRDFPVAVDEILLDEKYSWINPIQIDYKEIMDLCPGIARTGIHKILIDLGAKDSFTDLPLDRICSIIDMLPEKFPTGSKAQSFYKRALLHYDLNKQVIEEDIRLFADDGSNTLKPFPRSKVYFSDKIKLPRHLRKDYPVFYFPSRGGGGNAIQFFGINDLKDVKLSLEHAVDFQEATEEFRHYLDKIRPLLLAYRLHSIDEAASRKNQANLCSKIDIRLATSIRYNVNNKTYEVENYEFIHKEEQTYYIRIEPSDTLLTLRKNKGFLTSFAEVIALTFDVTGETNEYRHVLRNDYEEMVEIITDDFGPEVINDARELLGMADYKHAFWEGVFKSYGESYESLDDAALEALIQHKWHFEFDVNGLDYENLEQAGEVLKLKELFSAVGISPVDFVANYGYKFSLASIHKASVLNAIRSKSAQVKSSLWKSLSSKDSKEQSLYLEKVNLFEQAEEYVEKVGLQNEYQFHVNVEQLANAYIQSIFPELIIGDAFDLQQVRQRCLESFTVDERYIIEQHQKLRSLIYFANSIQVIREELEQLKKKENDGTTTTDDVQTATVILGNSESLTPKKPRKRVKGGIYLPTDENTRRQKESGNTSEKIVYDFLVSNNYSGVDHVAKDNEGLHYDIRYTDEHQNVKFVEVKTFDSDGFYLSISEYEFGLEHKEHYEIWLVKDKKTVIPIKDFFTNPKYVKTPNVYWVALEHHA